tara:strand:- start:3091 stop:3510 length:420 start_codon:yes stop_codon:yes gene_type:complete
MKWLDDRSSISPVELMNNKNSAIAACDELSNNSYDVAASLFDACAASTYAAEQYYDHGFYCDSYANHAAAAIDRYFDITGESERDYINAIESDKKLKYRNDRLKDFRYSKNKRAIIIIIKKNILILSSLVLAISFVTFN